MMLEWSVSVNLPYDGLQRSRLLSLQTAPLLLELDLGTNHLRFSEQKAACSSAVHCPMLEVEFLLLKILNLHRVASGIRTWASHAGQLQCDAEIDTLVL